MNRIFEALRKESKIATESSERIDKLTPEDLITYRYKFITLWKGAVNPTFADDFLELAEDHGCVLLRNDSYHIKFFACKDRSDYEKLKKALDDSTILKDFIEMSSLYEVDWDSIMNQVSSIYVDKYAGGYSVKFPKTESAEKSADVINEGIYGYFNYTRTGSRNKPIYSLVYGNNLLAKYDKNDWSFVLGPTWERHIDKIIEWLGEYYPGFFTKKDNPDSAEYYRFTPTAEEAIQYIKDNNITILSEGLKTESNDNVCYRSKETSFEIAEKIALMAKKSLRLPAHEVEMLEHDINNLRANEWVNTFAKLSNRSQVKQLFFKYAVEVDDEASYIAESKHDYREPIKCLQNGRGDYINVYKDKETGNIRAEGDIISGSFNGPWDDEKEEYYKQRGFKEVTEESAHSGSDWEYVEKTVDHDAIFGDITEGDYYIKQYDDNMTGYIYPPTESEKLYRAKLSNKTKIDSLGYNAFIELDAAKEFLDETARKLTSVTYEEIKQQLEEIDTHEYLEIDIDNSPNLNTTKVTIIGTLINGNEIIFYDSSFLRTQRDIDFIKQQYNKAVIEIDHMRERGYLGVKDEAMNSSQKPVMEYLEDAWDYSDDELASIYGGDTGHPDYEEELEDDMTIFDALMKDKAKVVENDSSLTPAEQELEKLGVDIDKAEKDGDSSYFNARIDMHTLKENGYKRIATNSDDPTHSVYTNGTWVVGITACSSGHVSIYRLGKKAKEVIDSGKEFDIFNKSLEESTECNDPADNLNESVSADSLDWVPLTNTRRVANFKKRGFDIEIDEHNSHVDGLHYYLTIEDTDLDDMICNGREFGSAEAALEYVEEVTAAPDTDEAEEFDINEGNAATFENTLEKEIKEAGRNFMMLPRIGFEENEIDEYFNVTVDTTEEYVKISVGAELSYSSLEDLCTELNKVIAKHDKDAYFEPECPGRAVAYLFGLKN